MSGADYPTTSHEHLTRDIPSEWTPIAEDGSVIALSAGAILRRDARRDDHAYGERVVLTDGDLILYQETYGTEFKDLNSIRKNLLGEIWRSFRTKYGIIAEPDDIKWVPYRDGILVYITKNSALHSCFAAQAIFSQSGRGLSLCHLTYSASRPGTAAVRLGFDALDFIERIEFDTDAHPLPIGPSLKISQLETEFAEIDAERSRVVYSGPGIITKREAKISPLGHYIERLTLGPAGHVLFEELPYGLFSGGGWDYMTTTAPEQTRAAYGFTFAPDDIKRRPFQDGVLFYVTGWTALPNAPARVCFIAEAQFGIPDGFGERRIQIAGCLPRGMEKGELFITFVIARHLKFKDGPAPWPPAA